jgi:uncharacterized protein YbbC (DUF1343 family)
MIIGLWRGLVATCARKSRDTACWLGACLLLGAASLPAHAQGSAAAPDATDLSGIGRIVDAEIRLGRIPGAVVVVGDADRIVYREAFGNARVDPEAVPMTTRTIFDLASLTKVVATTTAVMQLVEAGKLDLDAPAARYWPEFAANGKDAITVRELLTHYSGLAADLDMRAPWLGYQAAMDLIVAEQPLAAPGSRYIYSDINFEVLGEIVRRVSGQALDAYCEAHIFGPLGMHDTSFRPPASERARIAPTEFIGGQLRWGTVHDPSAARMGGVAGHAGLFSSAGDLARFAQMLLQHGTLDGVRILDPGSVQQMTRPQSPPGQPRLRGLGWDLAAPLAANREELPAVGAYTHTGYTGTLIWIDPLSGTYLIILSNRVYPLGRGDAQPLRKAVLQLLAFRDPPLPQPAMPGAVQAGIDALEADDFAPLKGMRVGLITNQTGVDARGASSVDAIAAAPGVRLAAIFTPEHGLHGALDRKVESSFDPKSGLPVYSLYGSTLRPTPQMLRGIDALVFDVQDAGARFYTYVTTMAYAMEAAATARIPIFVLDRPDPIDARDVQGPLLDPDLKSFTGYFELPVRYGMTLGELARMFNAENHLGADLRVIRMRNYRRDDWYDQTGMAWIDPSPNLRSPTEEALYPGLALLEGANVSVGRGTGTPFELLGAPWVHGDELAAYLNRRGIAGVRFASASFTPDSGRYQGRQCDGVRVILTQRDDLDSPALGVEIAGALQHLYPGQFHAADILDMVGSRSVTKAIQDGADPRDVAAGWKESVAGFERLRSRYLLY